MTRFIAALGLTAGLSSAAHAGVVLHSVTESKGMKSTETTMYVQNGMLRTEFHDAQGRLEHFMIVRDDALWQFTVREHKYMKMDRAAMQQLNAQMPPQVREMMQKMRGGDDKKSAWQDTGRTEHAGQYDCRVWTGEMIDAKTEMCIVSFSALPGGKELSTTLMQASRTLSDVLSNSFLAAGAKSVAEYAKFNGIPAVTRDERYGTTYLKGVELKAIPTELFQVPEGYEQQEMPWDRASGRKP
jgi:hypothetical protein